ncbi:hypothetical protein GIB67_006947 [Kingdonia uniflora]|uniref:Pentatricopeptide repeat-containing protein n=1 Tax=Kingdonia uniflora TaxID=39325 RepID=A0A7J7NZS4_9MAGN|nr:hypothetical protein GIB67_006947 [Kingdonia uniflora]
MNEMLRKGLKMDTVALNTFLYTLCNLKKLDEAYKLLHYKGYDPDEVSYSTLIMGCFKVEDVDRALKLWNEMKEREIIPSVVTYNSLIGGLCKPGMTEKAMTKLNELLESGLVPDETTYNTLIHGYCLEGNIEKAFQFHDKMLSNSFKPDVATCNILLHGLCKRDMIEKALKFFNKWVLKGKILDIITYNTLINCLCRKGRIDDDALVLFSKLEENKIGPDQFTYNSILCGLAEAGRTGESEEFLSKMIESGILPDHSALATATRVISDKGQSEKDQEVLVSETPHTNSDSETYSKRINDLCKKKKL